MTCRDQRLIAGLADHKRRAGCAPAQSNAGGQIVEHDDALARIAQRVDHVAADITGAAGDAGSSLRSTCVRVSPYRDLMNTAL